MNTMAPFQIRQYVVIDECLELKRGFGIVELVVRKTHLKSSALRHGANLKGIFYVPVPACLATEDWTLPLVIAGTAVR